MNKAFVLLLCFSSLSYSQENSDNSSTQEGDLNNNYQGATVDSNNTSESNTNQYNGAGASSQIPVSTATAPSLMSTGQDSCLKSLSAGVQSQVIGFSKGKYVQDGECNRRKDTIVLKGLGMTIAAIARMCQSDEVWEAMFSSGTPCPLSINGKLVVGKAAFITMRRQPEIFVPNYKGRKEYYDLVLGRGEKQDDSQEVGDTRSISERFRTSTVPERD